MKKRGEKVWSDRFTSRTSGRFWVDYAIHICKPRLPCRVMQCFCGSDHPCRIWGYCLN
jgi:hypothetical protein